MSCSHTHTRTYTIHSVHTSTKSVMYTKEEVTRLDAEIVTHTYITSCHVFSDLVFHLTQKHKIDATVTFSL